MSLLIPLCNPSLPICICIATLWLCIHFLQTPFFQLCSSQPFDESIYNWTFSLAFELIAPPLPHHTQIHTRRVGVTVLYKAWGRTSKYLTKRLLTLCQLEEKHIKKNNSSQHSGQERRGRLRKRCSSRMHQTSIKAAVQNVGCISLWIHKRVLLYSPF